MVIVDGNKVAREILVKLKHRIIKDRLRPHLAVVLVGNNRISKTYIKRKQEAAESIGVKFSLYHFPETISSSELESQLRLIQKEPLTGLIVQLPLPQGLSITSVRNSLNSSIDVDYFSWEAWGKLVIGENDLIPPTPGAVLEILRRLKIDLKGKQVVIVGSGALLGRPLANLFMHQPVTLTLCNKYTKNLEKLTKQADILITGVGKANLIRGRMVKKGTVVIDAGISFEGRKIHGDVNFKEVSAKASILTPTPGGVGPITVAKLLENTVINASRKFHA